MPPRIPTQADFAPLSSSLPLTLHLPSPPESTTTFLILLHGLGDSHHPFALFARNMSLPGVAALSIRGTSPLPPSLLPDTPSPPPPHSSAFSSSSSFPRDSSSPSSSLQHFHWGDDIRMDTSTGDIDPDPGFDAAASKIMRLLVRDILIDSLGWNMRDIMFFGFGQGGSLALGLASRLRMPLERVVELDAASGGEEPGPGASSSSTRANRGTGSSGGNWGETAKGVVSIGGPLPASMVPSLSGPGRKKSETPVLVVQLDEDEVDRVKGQFGDVRVVRWRRSGVGMPRDREEMFPLMKFFADQLNKAFS